MVVDDVARLPGRPLIVAEDTVDSAAGSAASAAAAVWLMTDVETVRARVAGRDGQVEQAIRAARWRSLPRTSRRPRARDRSQSTAETVAAVESVLRATDSARGPLATDVAARDLLRQANLASSPRSAGFYGRPWAVGDPEGRDPPVYMRMRHARMRDVRRRDRFVTPSARPIIAANHLS